MQVERGCARVVAMALTVTGLGAIWSRASRFRAWMRILAWGLADLGL